MTWNVNMEEDGSITLPAALVSQFGWTPETLLRWTDEEDGVSLQAVSEEEGGGSG